MPAVPITSMKQYERAIEVLTEIGGTWQGVGFEERFLLVSPRQYEALLEAKVVTPTNSDKDANHAKSARKGRKS